MPEYRDPIAVTLDTLRSDVERNPLADSLHGAPARASSAPGTRPSARQRPSWWWSPR